MLNSTKGWNWVSKNCIELSRNLCLILIGFYRAFLSPFLGGSCRFEPTCSVYAVEAFKNHHPWVAIRLTAKRICRCHPGGDYGLDPVPPALGKEA